ncbi:23 kDa integral membrane protein-like [Drosophila innubila]|uniref:23 kDa integral membrane protein-like n=1 Tax=Drosophila innubila TaxID=198719 RepID=UPI00148CBE2A|nr:23 kDa integral membrane protein-like [Drosophila innubila]
MGCGSELVKFILILFNVLCMACSVYILVYCFPIVKQIHDLSTMKEHLVINLVAIMPLVLAGLIFLMALLGCCGALRGSPCQLRTFSVIMLILFLATVGLVILVWTDHDKITHYIQGFIKESWKTHKGHNASSEMFHKLEKQFHCCGQDGPISYGNGGVPASCCGRDTGECQKDNAYPEGCLNKIPNLWDSHAKTIKYGTLAASGVTLLTSTFASFLAHKMVREAEYEYRYD